MRTISTIMALLAFVVALHAQGNASSVKEINKIKVNPEASDILTTAQKNASEQSEAIIREASEQAVAMKAKAEADIAQERRKAVNEIKDEIGGMAMEIAGKVIEREINEKDHARLIDEFIENVGGKA